MSTSAFANGHVNGFVNGHSKKKTSEGFGTTAVHTGSAPSLETGAVIPPISLSTTYAQSEGVGIHKGYEYTVRPLTFSRGALVSAIAVEDKSNDD